jgi:D-alanine-D-alanine ligase
VKIAIVYNRDSKKVINLFGVPNQETYGLKAIKRILDALKAGGHQAVAFEGDKDLIHKLEDFMPRVLHGERPGMVFNLSYGIQGKARYTHVPGMLEMLGIPYVGSGPLAHSLALDKVVSKMIFREHGLPTPDFAVLDGPGFPAPKIPYPLIVKPKDESTSYGIKIAHSEKELREAAQVIFDRYPGGGALVEAYIEGGEVNVGLLGNDPVEAMPPAQLVFGKGPQIYTLEDKKQKSGRKVQVVCPAPIDPALSEKAKELAVKAFRALGCADCARVDMRFDKKGNLYILEINSLPSLGEHGSFVEGGQAIGLDFPALINRLVEVASARYFGTPTPPVIARTPQSRAERVFSYITQRRDRIERRVRDWVSISSRTDDAVGQRQAAVKLGAILEDVKLRPAPELGDDRSVRVWESRAGLQGGTLLIVHTDVPTAATVPAQMFRREPERLFGEGIGCSRAPLAMLEYALRALRQERLLARTPLGVLCYSDEGKDARYSASLIANAASRAKNVLVLRPGNRGNAVITGRRGEAKLVFTARGPVRRVGAAGRRPEVFRWTSQVLEAFAGLSNPKKRLSVSVVDVRPSTYPLHLPHRVEATLLATYPDEASGEQVLSRLRASVPKSDFKWSLEEVARRPPMKERRANARLAKALAQTAKDLDAPLGSETSAWSSVAGLVPASTGVLCGVGPVATSLYTPDESVERLSLIQRTLLLARYLVDQAPSPKRAARRKVSRAA